jgi:hypothetical protein
MAGAEGRGDGVGYPMAMTMGKVQAARPILLLLLPLAMLFLTPVNCVGSVASLELKQQSFEQARRKLFSPTMR